MASVDLGIAVGAMSLGLVADAYGYRSVFLVAGGIGLVGLVYFFVYQRLFRRRTAAAHPA
jgi:predicted MFS family arabinose efflux permease